jgi:putative Mg2+ transporter-C (MgtC) family protein
MDIAALLESNRTFIPEYEIAVRLMFATVLGGIIGFERELKQRSAGLRTHMLTALAAAVFTVITFEILHDVGKSGTTNADPIRIIEAVTAGVAFLAAGAIIRGGPDGVKGLTTGAGMWTAGALGLASGGGYYVIALMGGILTLTILALLHRLERRLLDTK